MKPSTTSAFLFGIGLNGVRGASRLLSGCFLVTAMFGTVASPAAAAEAISSEAGAITGGCIMLDGFICPSSYDKPDSPSWRTVEVLDAGYIDWFDTDLGYMGEDDLAYFTSELAGDYEKLTNILLSFHDEKGEVIGKCVADSAVVKYGNVELGCELSGDAADSVVAFLLTDQGVEVFYVLEHGPGLHDHVEDYEGKHGNEAMDPNVVQLTLENVTATELQDLWEWSLEEGGLNGVPVKAHP